MMKNLLEETTQELSRQQKTPDDVIWVGSRNGEYAMSWAEFAGIANIEYDGGFGGQQIAEDLVVVGAGWWLERHEYDGSERWSFETPPTLKENNKPFSTVCNGDSWASIEEMNRKGGKYAN